MKRSFLSTFTSVIFFALFFEAFAALAGFPNSWNWRNHTPQGDLLNSVAYGDGRFVAVGITGHILVSTNGVDWVISPIASPGNLFAVVYGNGTYVAVGSDVRNDGGFIVISQNGVGWRRVLKGQAPFQSVSFENGSFFATTVDGAIFLSSNAELWQEVRSSDFASVCRVSFGNGLFVAIEVRIPLTSVDGVSWSKATKIAGDSAFRATTFGNGIFVAVEYGGGSTPNLYTSSDGVKWVPRATGINGSLGDITYGGGLFVAVGENGTIITSQDGVTWNRRPAGTFQGLTGIVYGAGQFVAVGDRGTILSSPDAANWALHRKGSSARLNGITYAHGRYVTVGKQDNEIDAAVLSSSDGARWEETSLGQSMALNGITATPEGFVAVGKRGTIVTSPDGLQWQAAVSNTPNDLNAVGFGAGLLVAIGERGTILTSPDAVQWTAQESMNPNFHLQAVTYGAGRFVVVGYTTETGGLALTSTDGLQWVYSALEQGYPLFGVAFGNGRFVAGGDFRLFVSADGVLWDKIAISPSTGLYIRTMCFGDGLFIALGEGSAALYLTGDRESIAATFPTERGIFGATYNNGSFFAAGAAGAILQSAITKTWSLTAPKVGGGNMEFTLLGIPGARYAIEFSTTIAGPNWGLIAEGILTEEKKSFQDRLAPGTTQRFYRAITQP